LASLAARGLLAAAAAIFSGIWNWPVWATLGWNDIQQRYRRSVIGPFWIMISLGVFISALGVVYSQLFGVSPEQYIPFLASGFLVWNLVSTLTNEGCSIFVEAEPIIKQVQIPLSTFAMRTLWRNVVVFLHCLPIYAFTLVIFPVQVGANTLMVFPGFLLLCLNLLWVVLALGIVCARFRDVTLIVQSALQVLFFLTPVFWQRDMLKGRAVILVDGNPLFHLIDVVRSPLIGEMPSTLSIFYVCVLAVLGWASTLYLYWRSSYRIAYWV
jgi:ABC-type polysaccharide/polyol phosphate export permease